MAMPDGSYVMAGGFSAGLPLRLFRDENGAPWLDIPDVERVRWMVGPAEWSGPGSETGATPTANFEPNWFAPKPGPLLLR